ncbi:phosphate acetyltransferase [Halomonas cupida]|uniref:phosphate acetyltransferase n=1 Tax=Halomonas cupida TaxID=44933 RepID=UPI003A9296E2
MNTTLSPRTLLLIPVDEGVALTSCSLGLMRGVDSMGLKGAFLQPFCQATSDCQGERSRTLIANTLGVNSPKPVDRITLERMLNQGERDTLLEMAVERHSHVLQPSQSEPPAVVLVEGLCPSSQSSYAFDLNVQLALALDAQVVLVADGQTGNSRELVERVSMHTSSINAFGANLVCGVMLMRLPSLDGSTTDEPTLLAAAGDQAQKLGRQWQQKLFEDGGLNLPVVAAVPWHAALSAPRVLDIARALGADILHEGEASRRRVTGITLGARKAEHQLHALRPGQLIVSPGDRDDTLLAAALATMNGIKLGGLLLTHSEIPSRALIEFCRPALDCGLPVLSISDDSYSAVKRLAELPNHIPSDDPERAETVARFIDDHLDRNWITQWVHTDAQRRLSPSAFRHQLVSLAQQQRRRIVLPEGTEPRTLEAAVICQRRGIADCVLLGKRQEILDVAAARGLELPEDLSLVDPDEVRGNFIAPMVERRRGKLNELTAEAQLQDSVVLGTMMLAEGDVDGLVSGAIHTTANTVRPAFQLIKTAPGYNQVSSIFFMLLPDQVVVYGDCAINPDPDAETLAEIALQSAASAEAFGIEPRVAMISYSTGESGTGADVDKVREATRIARERAPHLAIDGPLQYDAAAIASVGKQKAPDSPVAGRATVFVFPDLNTGNTTYKAVQRSARVISIGPMLQGLNKPVNDLSRGALVDDIVYTIALTAIQANQR